jgi:hypothetical protein
MALEATVKADLDRPGHAIVKITGLSEPPSSSNFIIRRGQQTLGPERWQRTETKLRPLAAAFTESDRVLTLILGPGICGQIQPGPLQLRLSAIPDEMVVRWPGDIIFGDDASLAPGPSSDRIYGDTPIDIIRDQAQAPETAEPTPAPSPVPTPKPNSGPRAETQHRFRPPHQLWLPGRRLNFRMILAAAVIALAALAVGGDFYLRLTPRWDDESQSGLENTTAALDAADTASFCFGSLAVKL